MDTQSIQDMSMVLALPVAFTIDPIAPLLTLSVCLRLGIIHDPVLLRPQFTGFRDSGFIAATGVVYVLHAAADKIPPLAHLFDLVGLLLKPLAVALIGLWFSNTLDPHTVVHWLSLLVVFAGGVPVSAAVQAIRTKARLGASVLSFGAALPVISTFENCAGLLLSTLAWLRPEWVVLFVLAIGCAVFWLSNRIAEADVMRRRWQSEVNRIV